MGEYAQSQNGGGGQMEEHPYVPTSYYYHSPPPESIDMELRKGAKAQTELYN